MQARHQLQSEEAILALIDQYFSNKHPNLSLGRGDDCAELLLTSPHLAVSSDIFFEDVHFRRSYFTPEEIGHKALAVNLSDLAATGAKAVAFSLNMLLPSDLSQEELSGILCGMSKLASEHDVALCGGDLSKASKLGFAITVYGEPSLNGCFAEKEQNKSTNSFLHRGQALKDDYIFIYGEFGLAKLALDKLEKIIEDKPQFNKVNSKLEILELRKKLQKQIPKALKAFLLPQPQIKAGLKLAAFKAENPEARIGLMDLSDGLLRDLPRLIGNKQLNAELDITELHQELCEQVFNPQSTPPQGKNTQSPNEISANNIIQACTGGEDYALVGTCYPKYWAKLKQKIPNLKKIGIVNNKSDMLINNILITSHGFDHFK